LVQNVLPEKFIGLSNDLKFPPPENYKNAKIDIESNQVVPRHDFMNDMHYVQELVNVFEHFFEGLEVQLVWFIKKRRWGDGFQTWHQDLVANATTAATIVVNIDSILEADELYQIEQIRESHRIMEEVSATTGSNNENDDRAPDATSSGPNNKNKSERGNNTGHSKVVTVHNLFRISTANKAPLPDLDDRKRPPEAPDDAAYGPNYENESEPGDD
jgi:hypothetical protein